LKAASASSVHGIVKVSDGADVTPEADAEEQDTTA